MVYMQGLGQNNNLVSHTISVTRESDLSKSVSTLSSILNIYKSVDRLVEVQEQQFQIQKEHNKLMEKRFDKLIECLSGGVTLQSAHTDLCFDDRSDDF